MTKSTKAKEEMTAIEIEGRYRQLYESMWDAFASVDLNGRIQEWNPAYQELVGYSPEELRQLTYRDLTPEKWHDLEARIVNEQVLVRGYSDVYVKEYRRKDGLILPVELRTFLIRDKKGQPSKMWAIVRDITKSLQAEKKYQTLFREMLNGFALHEIICDEEGQPVDYRFLAVNPAFERLTGLRADSLVGKTVLEVMPDTERHWIDTYGRVALTGEPVFFENYSVALAKYFEVTAFQPAPRQFACIFADVTARKTAMDALRESESRLRTISNNLVYGMIYQIVVQADGTRKFTYLSDNVKRFYGVTPQEAMNNANLIYGRIHEADKERVSREEEQAIKTLSVFQTEARIIRPDGGIRWSYFVSSPRPLADGTSCWDGIEFDITERKRMEEEKEVLQAQLHQAQKMESVGRLAGGVAHDFNNMLSVILGYADLLLGEVGPDDPKHEKIVEIRNAARRSGDLTRQLLAFARRQTVSPVIIDLNDAIGRMLKMIRRLIGEDIELIWRPGAALAKVKIDPSQIDQILANLCVNARDAIAGHGTVTIETANTSVAEGGVDDHPGVVPGDYVTLSMHDDGCGMDLELQGSIFDPFFTTKGLGKGTGLGLSTVYGIVKQNHGCIRVASESGKGTTFILYLPVGVGTVQDVSTSMAAQTDAVPSGQKETVLVVEDEQAILEMVCDMLARLGYQVLSSGSPGEAIRLAKEYAGEIHLLLTDVVMPEMNGRDLADRLLPSRPALKRLYMSGYTANVIAHHGVLDKEIHFIHKPFTLQELGAMIRSVLEKP